MTATAKRIDIYTRVTDQIVAERELGEVVTRFRARPGLKIAGEGDLLDE